MARWGSRLTNKAGFWRRSCRVVTSPECSWGGEAGHPLPEEAGLDGHSPRGPSAPPLAGIGLPRERWQPDLVGRARAPSRTTLEPARAGVLQLLSHRQGVRHRPERNGKEKKPGRLLLHSWEKSQSGISKEREEGVQGITGSARRRLDELWFFPSLKSSPRHGP